MSKRSCRVFILTVVLGILLFAGCSLNNPFFRYDLSQSGGEGADVDLSNYYTKIEVNNLLLSLKNINLAADASIDQSKIAGGKFGFVPFYNADGDVSIDKTIYTQNLVIGNRYKFPNSDGQPGYILKTDGAGNLTWQTDNSGSAADNMGDHTATKNIALGNYWLSGDGGSNGIFIKNGKVGVGNNAPVYPLDVSGSIRMSSGSLVFPDGSTMTSAATGSASSLSNSADVAITADSDSNGSGAILMKIGGSEKMVITNGGYVGINTATPASTLSVGANSQFQVNSTGNIVKINNVAISFPSTQGTPGQVLTNDGSGTLSWTSPPSAPVTSVFGRTGAVIAAANDYTWAMINKTTSSLADITTRSAADLTSGNLAIARMPTGGNWTLSSNLNIDSNTMVVDYTNNRVGLLTATPASTLSVGANSQFQVNSTGNIVKINNVAISFPSTQGTPGQVLTNDGSGTLSWTSPPSAPVTSVFGRTGAVIAAANDYTWAMINKTTSSLADITTRSAADLTSGNLAIARMPTGGNWTLSSNLNIDSNTMVVDYTNNRVGINTATPEFRLTLDKGAATPDGGILAMGTRSSGATLSASGAGTRMIWYPRKAAFRAGYVNGTQWDDANIGDYSVAMGYSTTASGHSSTAMGGYNTASGECSTAMGSYNTASGNCSTAMGTSTTASGSYSTVMGSSTKAQSYASLVAGQYNVVSGTTNEWIDTDPLFVLGNGVDPSSRSNAFVVYKNANVEIKTLSTNGAVYSNNKILTNVNPSSREYKKNIKDIDLKPERLLKLQPKSFIWKSNNQKDISYIAEEVRDIIPELFQDDGLNKGFDVAKLPFYIIELVKKQQTIIDAQKEELSLVNDKLKILETTLSAAKGQTIDPDKLVQDLRGKSNVNIYQYLVFVLMGLVVLLVVVFSISTVFMLKKIRK
ncbi:MAG TPA: tail fiber domain-containing protein [Spirochaetota bacterium]|nr:tail fiber domain-containing protein [Spirochaetota bacterium]